MQTYILIVLIILHIIYCNKVQGHYDNEDSKSSLVFVFDVTGSMYNDLEQLREGAEMIIDTAIESEKNVISNFVFVPFHDPKVGPATVTQSKEVFKAALDSVRVRGGGDCPERSLTGIQLALNVSLPRSYVYVLTDATAADYALVNNVLDQIQRKQSQVVFLLTGHCNDTDKSSYKVYQQIAGASSGQIFNLNKTSVHKVLEFVRSSVTGRLVNLGTVVNPAGTNYTQPIPVDSTVGEVTVSVSGSNPQIKVVDPTGEEIKGPPKLVTTLDLSEIMVVKVLQPEPGNWTITVGSEDDYSVRVFGLSNLTFQHGFSLHKPKSMVETSYRPLQGAHNYMMIKLTESNRPVKVKFAEILTIKGKSLFELPLSEIDSKNRIYLTEAFIPPENYFYIAINGLDENNQELRRIGATAVEAKLPSIPYLMVRNQVSGRLHQRVTLRCVVESLVPVSAQWTLGTTRLQSASYSVQSSVTEYVIEDLTEKETGTYRCIAQNIAGLSKAFTTVSLIVDPPAVSMEPNNITLFSGENFNILCTVYSEAQLNSFYFKFTGPNVNKVLDATLQSVSDGYYYFNKTFGVDEKNNGFYSCYAANKAGENHKKISVTVLSRPVAQIHSDTLTVKSNGNIKLLCHIENAENLQWIAPNSTIVSNMQIESDTYDSVLNVYNASETDDGDWKCLARKRSLKVLSTVNVVVTIKPVVTAEGPTSFILYYGTQYTLKCVIKAKPVPDVLWIHGGDTLQEIVVPASYDSHYYVSSRLISNVTKSIEGMHKCLARNIDGTSEETFLVKVVKNMTVLQPPKNISVELYKPSELHCLIDSYPKAEMKWYQNSSLLALSNNVHLLENNTIIINRTDFENSGTYSCEARNNYQRLVLNVTLDIFGLEPPILVKDLTKFTAQEGKSAKIQCRISQGKPRPEVHWKRKINNSYYTALTDGVNEKSNELLIPKVEVHHTGTYTCIAKNAIGEDYHDVFFSTQYSPIMVPALDKPIGKMEIAKGTRVDLNCEVLGEPKPLSTWTKDNKTINYTKNVYLTDTSLIIDNATESDSGLFSCVATNILGSAQKNFSLFVYVSPVILESSLNPEIEVLEGDIIELPCYVYGVPVPSVEWRQNQDIIADNRKFIDEQHTLRFIANLTDFGEYECIARSKFGTTSRIYYVYVWAPPFIDPPLRMKKEVLIGTNTSLHCNAVGFPVPTFFWEFDERIISQNSSDLNFNTFGDMFITNTTRKHEGLYGCVAENVAGYSKKTFQLSVNEPPRIISENFTGPYIATEKDTILSIPCKTIGKPIPLVKWMKENIYLNRDSRYDIEVDGTLSIKFPMQEMSGNYTCVAENTVGAVKNTVFVEIYSIPKPIQGDEARHSVTAVEGSNAEVHCPILASYFDTIKWYKEGHLLKEGPLIFYNVSRFNASNYGCVVSNAVGSASVFIDLNVEWPPSFSDNYTKKIEIDERNDIYFDCQVDAKPEAECKWLLNAKQLIGEKSCHLKLINVKKLQTGTYTCIATNVHGTTSRRFQLDVLARPHISDFDFLEVQLKEGTNTTIPCNSVGTPKPDIYWEFDNKEWKVQNSSLVSENITTRASGLFKCIARNKVGVASIVYQIIVLVPAKVNGIVLYNGSAGIDIKTKAEILLGNYARVACEGSGSPMPQIQWFKNGKIINESGSDAYYADLLFQNINRPHSGSYSCIVSNYAGKEERKFILDVLEPPKIFTSIFDETSEMDSIEMEVMIGQSFYLHCHPYGNPTPELYWFKNDVVLRFYNDEMVSTEFGEILVSKSATKELSGNYTCIVRNKVGESAISYLVDVLVPPQNVKNNPIVIRSRVGMTVDISCPFEGTPMPSVLWIKLPYAEITSESFPNIDLRNDNVTLVIPNAEVSDNGKYSCVITNKVGTAEVIFEVIIEKPPSILSNTRYNNTEDHTVPLGRSTILKCLADGYPRPKVSWLRNTIELGQNLSNLQRALSNSLLTIWRIGVRDAGQYICVVENSAGAEHRRFNIRVKVPGKWSKWSQWNFCNVSCGLGYQHRSRSCQYIDDYFTIDAQTNNSYALLDRSECKGSTTDRRKCHMPACEGDRSNVTGHWSAWSPWSACSVSCGAGTVMRTRRCRPSAAKCRGDNIQIRQCSKSVECNTSNIESGQSNVDNSSGLSHNPYIPVATYENQPETLNPYEFDVDFVRANTGLLQENVENTARRYFDIIVNENIDHSPVDLCDAGYRHNATIQECEDIDECLYPNNQCHSTQLCHNTLGGYSCSCPTGYTALGAAQRCLDINECEQGTHHCEFACVNVAGGYVCACPRHLRLHSDKHHCVSPALFSDVEDMDSGEILNASIDNAMKYR